MNLQRLQFAQCVDLAWLALAYTLARLTLAMLTQPFLSSQTACTVFEVIDRSKSRTCDHFMYTVCFHAYCLFHNEVVLQLVDNPAPAGSMIRTVKLEQVHCCYEVYNL